MLSRCSRDHATVMYGVITVVYMGSDGSIPWSERDHGPKLFTRDHASWSRTYVMGSYHDFSRDHRVITGKTFLAVITPIFLLGIYWTQTDVGRNSEYSAAPWTQATLNMEGKCSVASYAEWSNPLISHWFISFFADRSKTFRLSIVATFVVGSARLQNLFTVLKTGRIRLF